MKKFLVVIVLIVVIIGGKFYIDLEAKKEVDAAINEVRSRVNLSYKKVNRDLLGWRTHIKDATLAPVGSNAKMQVEDVIVYQSNKQNENPVRLHIAFKGIHLGINADNLGDQAKRLNQLGYQQEIKGEMELDYRYDREKKVFDLNTFRFGAKDVGRLTAELHLSNIDLNPNNFTFLLLTFPTILLNRAEIEYQDDSLMPRLQKAVADQEGKTVEELVGSITKDLDAKIAKEDNKFSKDALNALKKFVQHPEKITVTIAPKEPVALGRFQHLAPIKLPEILNMKIES
jgi:hypothetical protein